MTARIQPDRFVVDQHGHPEAVILSFAHYQQLLRQAEDRDDARALNRAIRTVRGTITHAELLERLKRQRLM